jgi:CRISPR/Cas system-associated endonuclease Cas3-HD
MAVRAISPGSDERVFWATLLHDVGKASTTKYVEGRWRAIGHVKQGTALVAPILERFNLCRITSDVKWLVKHHHFALDWGDSVLAGLSQRQKKLCDSPLFPLLVEVCRADDVASLGSSEKGSKLDFILAQLK